MMSLLVAKNTGLTMAILPSLNSTRLGQPCFAGSTLGTPALSGRHPRVGDLVAVAILVHPRAAQLVRIGSRALRLVGALILRIDHAVAIAIRRRAAGLVGIGEGALVHVGALVFAVQEAVAVAILSTCGQPGFSGSGRRPCGVSGQRSSMSKMPSPSRSRSSSPACWDRDGHRPAHPGTDRACRQCGRGRDPGSHSSPDRACAGPADRAGILRVGDAARCRGQPDARFQVADRRVGQTEQRAAIRRTRRAACPARPPSQAAPLWRCCSAGPAKISEAGEVLGERFDLHLVVAQHRRRQDRFPARWRSAYRRWRSRWQSRAAALIRPSYPLDRRRPGEPASDTGTRR